MAVLRRVRPGPPPCASSGASAPRPARHRRSPSRPSRPPWPRGLRVALGFVAGLAGAIGAVAGIVGVRPRPRLRPLACGSPSASAARLGRSSPSRQPACAWREPSGRPIRMRPSRPPRPPRQPGRSTGSAVEAGAWRGRPGAGFWATWARSRASSSGGTSLHGSFEPRAAGAAAGRSLRPRPRSSRGGGACWVRPLTSG